VPHEIVVGGGSGANDGSSGEAVQARAYLRRAVQYRAALALWRARDARKENVPPRGGRRTRLDRACCSAARHVATHATRRDAAQRNAA
jgi:hypothetical protein